MMSTGAVIEHDHGEVIVEQDDYDDGPQERYIERRHYDEGPRVGVYGAPRVVAPGIDVNVGVDGREAQLGQSPSSHSVPRPTTLINRTRPSSVRLIFEPTVDYLS